MKKHTLCVFVCFLILANIFISVFCGSKNNETYNYANATTSNQQSTDIFIKHPTFSTIHNNKVHFIDEVDNSLKTYDLTYKSFTNSYKLSSYSNIIDAVSLNEFFILLVETQQDTAISCKLVFINLIDFSITENETSLSHFYNKLYAEKIIIENTQQFIVTLTSSDPAHEDSIILLIDFNTFETTHSTSINFGINENINNNLYKIFTTQNPTTKELNIIVFYSCRVAYGTLSYHEDILNKQSITINEIPDFNHVTLSNSVPSINIHSINLMSISSKKHFVITYIDDESNEAYTPHFYYYNIGSSANTEFTDSHYVRCSFTGKILTNNNYIIYSNNQNIYYQALDCTESNLETINRTYSVIDNGQVTNPTLEFKQTDFIYKQTKKEIKILQNPWDFEDNSMQTIPANTDIICIGYPQIVDSEVKISGYSYCLYTTGNINYIGIVEDNVNTLQAKTDNSHSYSNAITVYENTPLYSMPSVASKTIYSNSNLNCDFDFKIVKYLHSQTKINIIDAIYGYESNNAKLIKVEINGHIGYINCKDIYPKNNIVDYITTNSFIKTNGTKVYSASSEDAEIIDILNKDKDVYIEGKRDTKTGYTYIQYNDEYGNLLSGYIKTDYLETNSWSVMQIIGCILIAINFGLLILILVFKKNNIGKDGQKYVNNKSPNYKQ